MAGGITLREILLRWRVEVDKTSASNAQQTIANLQQNTQALRSQFMALSVAATGALAALALPALAMQEAVRKTMTVIPNLGAGMGKMESDLTSRAMALGELVGKSTEDISGMFFEVISAGVDPLSKGFDKLSMTAAKLGTAFDMELGTATRSLANITAGYGDSVEAAGRVANVLINANAKYMTDVPQLVAGFETVAGQARSMGMAYEDTAVMLGVFSNAGLRGSEGAIALSETLTRLGTEGQAALDQLGVSMFDAKGKTRDMFLVFEDLKKALSGLTDQERARISNEILGERAGRKFSQIMGQNMLQARATSAEFKKSGDVLDEAFNVRMGAATSQVGKFWQSLRNLAATLGMGLLEPLGKIAKRLGDMVRGIRAFLDAHKGFTKITGTILGFVLASVAAGSAISALILTMKIGALTMQMLGVKTAVAGIQMLLMPAAIVALIIVIGLLIEDIYQLAKGNDSALGQLDKWLRSLPNNLGPIIVGVGALALVFFMLLSPIFALIVGIVALGAASVLLITHWEDIKKAADDIWNDIEARWEKGAKFIADKIDFLAAKTRELLGLAPSEPGGGARTVSGMLPELAGAIPLVGPLARAAVVAAQGSGADVPVVRPWTGMVDERLPLKQSPGTAFTPWAGQQPQGWTAPIFNITVTGQLDNKATAKMVMDEAISQASRAGRSR